MEGIKLSLKQFWVRNANAVKRQVRSYTNYYFNNGPLAMFVETHPTVALLSLVTIASVVLIILCYTYYFLSWSTHFIVIVLRYFIVISSYLLSAVGILLECLVQVLQKASQFIFSITLPAVLFTTGCTLLAALPPIRGCDPLRKMGTTLELDHKTIQAVKIAIPILLGLFNTAFSVLPRMARRVVSHHLSDQAILFLVSMTILMMYGLYRFVKTGTIEDGPDRDDNCRICFENPKSTVLKPCQHFAVCTECVARLHECPICRAPIEGSERIYTT